MRKRILTNEKRGLPSKQLKNKGRKRRGNSKKKRRRNKKKIKRRRREEKRKRCSEGRRDTGRNRMLSLNGREEDKREQDNKIGVTRWEYQNKKRERSNI